MKILNQHLNPSDKSEITASQEQESQLILLGTLKPQRGQSVFELDIETGKVTEAEFDESVVDFSKLKKGDNSVKSKIKTKPNHLYTVAINKKNAIRHFQKDLIKHLKPEYHKIA